MLRVLSPPVSLCVCFKNVTTLLFNGTLLFRHFEAIALRRQEVRFPNRLTKVHLVFSVPLKLDHFLCSEEWPFSHS